MIGIASDCSGSPRICPRCGAETDSILCGKYGIKTFSLSGPAGIFTKKLRDGGRLEGTEFFNATKFGYDLRMDLENIRNPKRFFSELEIYFSALEESAKPKIIVFSKDQRFGHDKIQGAFDSYISGSGVESAVVDKFLSTTVSCYIGGMISFKESRDVLALHATASHNPPNYNGVKSFFGTVEDDVFVDGPDMAGKISGDEGIDSFVNWCSQFPVYSGDITFDLMNGAGCFSFPRIASRYPRAKLMNTNPSPDFGGLIPEPLRTTGWKGFGFAFDGDADRSTMYYGGKQVFFSRFLAGMVKEGFFDERKVIVDQRTPPSIIKFLESFGIKTIMGCIGNTLQAELSRKHNALWFEENWHNGGYRVGGGSFFWGVAPFSVAFWLGRMKAPIEKVLEDVPDFQYTEERFKVSPGFNEKVIDCAESRGIEHSRISEYCQGGIRIEDNSGHMLMRESNTEIGTVKLIVTGIDRDSIDRKLKLGRELVSAVEG